MFDSIKVEYYIHVFGWFGVTLTYCACKQWNFHENVGEFRIHNSESGMDGVRFFVGNIYVLIGFVDVTPYVSF